MYKNIKIRKAAVVFAFISISFLVFIVEVRYKDSFSKATQSSVGLRNRSRSSLQRGRVRYDECNLDYLGRSFTKEDEIYLKEYNEFSSVKTRAKAVLVLDDPTLNLDSEKFILPILIRGPNNQLAEIKETIYMAIRLNRTFVIPHFFKHRTDRNISSGMTVHPGHRVNFDIVCKFISCVTLNTFRQTCGYKADVILRTRYYNRPRLAYFEKLLGMRILDEDERILSRIIPSSSQIPLKQQIYHGTKKDDIIRYYGTKERCAIYPMPFHNLKLPPMVSVVEKFIEKKSDINNIPDKILYSNILSHVTFPQFILEIANEFRFENKIGNYISVHWRYNKQDWASRCNTIKKSSKRFELCSSVAQFDPDVMSRNIHNTASRLKVTTAYIAMPASETSVKKSVTETLTREHGMTLFTANDLLKTLKQKYHECDFISSNIDDILSTVEMAICYLSTVFLRSSHSSWSGAVYRNRLFNSRNHTRVDLDKGILEAMENLQ